MKETAAIVLAAGQGTRMKSKIAKQFLYLDGKPVVYYALKAFQDAGIEEIILVTNENSIAYCKKEIIEKYGLTQVKQIIAGGKERYESVFLGLQAITDKKIVFIHDGARPFLNQELLERAYTEVNKAKACVVGMPVKDTIKVVDDEQICVDTPKRSNLWQVQTPQVFYTQEIFAAYQKMMCAKDNLVTDDAMVMEKYGERKVKLIEGDYENIKITTPEDLIIADAFIQKRKLLYK